MLTQERATGGFWFSYGGLNGVIDPGPGSLVRITEAFPKLNPMTIRALLLTHRHIDHSTDFNVLCEAMTDAGHKKQGVVLTPADARELSDSVVHPYIAKKIKHDVIMRDGLRVPLSETVSAEPVLHNHHGVECYGLIFRAKGLPTWGIISDTAPVPWLAERYAECAVVSVNTTIPYPNYNLEHFSAPDVASLLGKISPKLLILSHLGRAMLTHDLGTLTRHLCTPHTRVVAAEDGMIVDLQTATCSQGQTVRPGVRI